MLNTKIGQIKAYGTTLDLVRHAYSDGNLAIEAVSAEDGERYGVLTVNLPQSADLGQNGEFAVKTWNENAPMREPALASGLFVDTGRRIRTGWTEAEIWRLAD